MARSERKDVPVEELLDALCRSRILYKNWREKLDEASKQIRSNGLSFTSYRECYSSFVKLNLPQTKSFFGYYKDPTMLVYQQAMSYYTNSNVHIAEAVIDLVQVSVEQIPAIQARLDEAREDAANVERTCETNKRRHSQAIVDFTNEATRVEVDLDGAYAFEEFVSRVKASSSVFKDMTRDIERRCGESAIKDALEYYHQYSVHCGLAFEPLERLEQTFTGAFESTRNSLLCNLLELKAFYTQLRYEIETVDQNSYQGSDFPAKLSLEGAQTYINSIAALVRDLQDERFVRLSNIVASDEYAKQVATNLWNRFRRINESEDEVRSFMLQLSELKLKIHHINEELVEKQNDAQDLKGYLEELTQYNISI